MQEQMELIDPLEEGSKLELEDLLPIHYRMLLWICNHLVLYSILVASTGAGAMYYIVEYLNL